MDTQSDSTGLLQLIWKYRLHYVIVLPALFLISIFKIWPFVCGVILSFQDYKPFRGIMDSEWVSLNNFIHLFHDPTFHNALSNTIIIKVGYILASGICATVIALALSSIRSKWLRQSFSTLFLIPFFISSVVISNVVMYILSPAKYSIFPFDILVLGEPALFRIILILVEVFKTCGIPIVIAMAAIASKHAATVRKQGDLANVHTSYLQMNIIPAIRAVTAFMLLQLSAILSTDFELVQTLINPLVYEAGATLDLLSFGRGFMLSDFSFAAAVGLIQFGIQFLFALIAYYVVRGSFLYDLFSFTSISNIGFVTKKRNVAGIVVASIYSFIVLVPLYVLFVDPFTAASNSELSLWQLLSSSNILKFMFINSVQVFIYLLITLTLAFPLTVKDLPGRGLYKLFLLFVLVMGTGVVNEFIVFKSLGMIGTIFPHLFLGLFNIVGVFVLKNIFNSKYAGLKDKANAEGRGELWSFFMLFIPKVWKPLLALGVLQFVSLWNSYNSSILYEVNPERFSPILQFRQISSFITPLGAEPSDPIILQLGALLSLPTILLFFLFRKWLTSELFVSQVRKL